MQKWQCNHLKLEVQSTLMKITVAKIVLTIAEIIYQWLKSSSAITNLNSATTKTEIDTVRINYKRTLFLRNLASWNSTNT